MEKRDRPISQIEWSLFFLRQTNLKNPLKHVTSNLQTKVGLIV